MSLWLCDLCSSQGMTWSHRGYVYIYMDMIYTCFLEACRSLSCRKQHEDKDYSDVWCMMIYAVICHIHTQLQHVATTLGPRPPIVHQMPFMLNTKSRPSIALVRRWCGEDHLVSPQRHGPGRSSSCPGPGPQGVVVFLSVAVVIWKIRSLDDLDARWLEISGSNRSGGTVLKLNVLKHFSWTSWNVDWCFVGNIWAGVLSWLWLLTLPTWQHSWWCDLASSYSILMPSKFFHWIIDNSSVPRARWLACISALPFVKHCMATHGTAQCESDSAEDVHMIQGKPKTKWVSPRYVMQLVKHSTLSILTLLWILVILVYFFYLTFV